MFVVTQLIRSRAGILIQVPDLHFWDSVYSSQVRKEKRAKAKTWVKTFGDSFPGHWPVPGQGLTVGHMSPEAHKAS